MSNYQHRVPRIISAALAIFACFLFSAGCANNSPTPLELSEYTFLPDFEVGRSIETSFMANNPSSGPPFPLLRFKFDFDASEDVFLLSQQFADNNRAIGITFSQLYRIDSTTDMGHLQVTYQGTFFQAHTNFAEGNALSKWINCRHGILSRRAFRINSCLEVNPSDPAIRSVTTTGEIGRLIGPMIEVGPLDSNNRADEVEWSGARSNLETIVLNSTALICRTMMGSMTFYEQSRSGTCT